MAGRSFPQSPKRHPFLDNDGADSSGKSLSYVVERVPCPLFERIEFEERGLDRVGKHGRIDLVGARQLRTVYCCQAFLVAEIDLTGAGSRRGVAETPSAAKA